MPDSSLAISIYRAATTAAAPFARGYLQWRRLRGKEDPGRLDERFGFAGKPRRPGRLAWLHGASVGESLALLTLVPHLTARGLQVLITTGTLSSARILAARLPPSTVHQYAPLDCALFWRRFLHHWRPDFALIAESELWPNMLREAKRRGLGICLVNARMSPRSFARWRRFPGLVAAMLRHIDLCLAQTDGDAARFTALGARNAVVAGNLKYDAPAPPVNANELSTLSAAIGPRPVWLAASTHADEEEIAFAVHRRLAGRFPALLTIVAPRHAERGAEIAALAARAGLAAARRSLGQPIEAGTRVYIADTMGEAGLYYRLATIVFVGKSLASGGGQNPIEPAKLGGAILHGPDVSNFRDVYSDLDRSGGARQVGSAEELADGIEALLSDGAELRRMARAAADCVARVGGACEAVIRAVEPWIARLAEAERV